MLAVSVLMHSMQSLASDRGYARSRIESLVSCESSFRERVTANMQTFRGRPERNRESTT